MFPCRTRLVLLGTLAFAMLASSASAAALAPADSLLEDGYQFREIGPFRGGRSGAVAGIAGDASHWYFGATGGGVFRTEDSGQSWESVSDGFFGGSIGAIAIAESDPNVIYVGGGEQTVRGNVSHGYGMFKSLDGGKSWANIGLTDSRHIGRIRIHPKDADLVYVAAMGHLFGPNEERGLYRSRDGGESFERVLFVDEDTGCVDLAMDPRNPRNLYASFWQVRRAPHRMDSGGPGSNLFMSTDGGDSWTSLKERPGMPAGVWGNNALTVSPQNPDRLWAMIEAKEGGVFRSDDQGETWTRVNDERKLRQRAWYYTRIYADPQDADTVYVLNVRFWKSKDGGKSFESIDTPHGDHHDLWIDPTNSAHFIIGDDGGAQVTLDGGENFTTYHNQATAQFYRVTVDDHFPYRIYGAQQDNSTVRIVHRSDAGRITDRDWEPTAGGESGWIAPDPRNNDIVYGGSYDGFLTRYDHATGETRAVNVWPDNPMGHGAEGMKERFQWNFPILFSRHEPGLLYAAGNRLFATRDEGATWTAISGDLTRNDPEKLKSSGGPITQDNTSVEYYCTIFAVAEDAFEPGVIWAGSDDGLVHLTRDGGRSWEEVTPKGLPEWIQINSIEADPHRAGGAYLAATNYKNDDFAPYLYRTRDYGRSWKKIVRGIDDDHFTRVVRSDPHREGMLFAGTETGLYLSLDDGEHWEAFQLNLPIVPITDLAIKENDLVVATQGRSFWVLDDLTVLHQWTSDSESDDVQLFAPRATWRMSGRGVGSSNPHAGANPPNGAVVFYRFASEPDSEAVKLEILDADGETIRSYSPKAKEKRDQMTIAEGMNRLVWNLQLPPAEKFDGMILWWARTDGPRVLPGRYQARLTDGEHTETVEFELKQDPRSSATARELQEQFDFLVAVRDRLSEVHRAIGDMRALRAQLKQAKERMDDEESELAASADSLLERIEAVETALYQTKNRSRQDPLNFPVRLNNKLGHLAALVAMGDNAPTASSVALRKELDAAIAEQLEAWEQLRGEELEDFNRRARGAELPALHLDAPSHEAD